MWLAWLEMNGWASCGFRAFHLFLFFMARFPTMGVAMVCACPKITTFFPLEFSMIFFYLFSFFFFFFNLNMFYFLFCYTQNLKKTNTHFSLFILKTRSTLY
jgi:hypothetical protein